MFDDLETRFVSEIHRNAVLNAHEFGARPQLLTWQAGRQRQGLDAERHGAGSIARYTPECFGLTMASHAKDKARGSAMRVSLRADGIGAEALTAEADCSLRVFSADVAALNQPVLPAASRALR